MPRFAILDNKVGAASIINILIADNLETAQQLTQYFCKEVNDSVGTHWYFDGTKFIEPTPMEITND